MFFVCQTLPGISNEEAKNCRRKKARGGGQCREKKTGEETQGVFSTLTVRWRFYKLVRCTGHHAGDRRVQDADAESTVLWERPTHCLASRHNKCTFIFEHHFPCRAAGLDAALSVHLSLHDCSHLTNPPRAAATRGKKLKHFLLLVTYCCRIIGGWLWRTLSLQNPERSVWELVAGARQSGEGSENHISARAMS